MFSGDQRRTESTHDTCNIRSYGLTVCDLLETPEYCIIIEGTALYDDISAQFRSVRDFDYLKKGIFDHRVGKAGGNVGDGSTFLLCLFYFRIHEYGTAGT